MRIICNTREIADRIRTTAKLREVKNAGFEYISMDASSLCRPSEFSAIRKKNFKRGEEYYLSENPEKLAELAEKLYFNPTTELGLTIPIASTPYASNDTKPNEIDIEVIKRLAKETLKTSVGIASIKTIVVYPLTIGIDDKDEREINRAFYLELSKLLDDLNSDIQILLINRPKTVNGHLIRGFCSDSLETAKFIDELNELVGSKNDRTISQNSDTKENATNDRFGFCFDIGCATVCGQDLYETIAPLGDRVKAVIVRDCDGIHDSAMMPFSACEIGQQTDWLGFFRAMRKIDFDGDIILDFSETYASYPEKLRPSLLRLGKELGDYLLWQIGMERMVKKYDKRVLFGAGNMCRAYMKNYGEEYPPLFTCDNNSSRWGEEFCGLTVQNPEKLKELPEDVAIFICNLYYDEIREQLRNMGLKNPIECFNDEYMPTFHMDRLKMTKEEEIHKK